MSANILVIAEHDGAELYPGTLNTVAAAAEIAAKSGGEIHILLVGENLGEIAKSCAKAAGVAKVLVVDDAKFAHPGAEDVAAQISAALKDGAYSHALAPASTFGKAVIPYAAALLDKQAISDISEVSEADTFVRPIYAGNAMETVKSLESPVLLTVRTTAFEPAATDGNAAVENAAATEPPVRVKFIEQALSSSERPELTSARVVVSGGRGMQNGENFAMLEKLADKLGGAVGASRAAVDAGFVPNEYQVGQTGKVVAPDLYLAVGISGAIQHLAGMKDSKCIVAINNDEEAPIFQVADYSWCEDLFTAVPALQGELEK